MNKRIQYGASSFKEIKEANALYIDKTKKIYELISEPTRRFFISRPRRFGKSLFIDILFEIFQGNRELFKGLHIYNTDYDWTSYPVIRLDMSSLDLEDIKSFKESLLDMLREICNSLKIDQSKLTSTRTPKSFLSSIIKYVTESEQKVVILVDEYDYPILKNIDIEISLLEKFREILKDFYITFKQNSGAIRFLLLTGIGSFSKTSIFSGMNDLSDISSSEKYADLLGYTQEDLEKYFAPFIDEGATKLGLTRESFIEEIKLWYDGGFQMRTLMCIILLVSTCFLLLELITLKHTGFLQVLQSF